MLSREVRNFRKLAQEWFGLTDEQMKDCDVHHNPPRSQGGRNIPEHLFVLHPTLHAAVHQHDFVLWAREGAKKGNEKLHSRRDAFGKSLHSLGLHSEKDEEGRSVVAVKGARKAHSRKDEFGRSFTALKAGRAAAKKLHSKKNELGRSIPCAKGGKNSTSQRWEDPDHPELGRQNAGNLVRMQKRRGFPHGKENRRRVQ